MGHIGILGGTFNPPHVGHLVCAQEAASQLSLDRVLVIPVNTPPHKELDHDPGARVRLELCRAAIEGDPVLMASSIEVDRDGPSYTVDTLRTLHDHRPQDSLIFIVGADMAHALPAWRDPAGIVEIARVAVAEREGIRRDDIIERLGEVPGARGRVDFFTMPRMDISSSDIRRRVAAGRPIRHLVPEPVRDLIESRGLYR